VTLKQLLGHPKVKGVAIGACVDGSRMRHRAHAHDGPPRSTRYIGWICILSPDDLKPEILLEELSHLVAETDGIHDETFQETRRELRKQYRKKRPKFSRRTP